MWIKELSSNTKTWERRKWILFFGSMCGILLQEFLHHPTVIPGNFNAVFGHNSLFRALAGDEHNITRLGQLQRLCNGLPSVQYGEKVLVGRFPGLLRGIGNG